MEAEYLSPDELAGRWRLSRATLAKWRCKGGGPDYIKIGRSILYAIVDVQKFEYRSRDTALGAREPAEA